MSRQDQEVRGGSLAVQSGRDTVIQQGLSPAQMKEIMEAIARQLPGYAAIAREVVDQRLRDFEDRVITRFADTSSTRSEAFKDPDFTYVVTRAQNAYARSGDEQVREALVDLIARRSLETNRTRLSLSLDEAVEKAALLTKNEFAELSFIYLIRYTRNVAIRSLDDVAEYLNRYVVPLLPDICETDSSYQYLEAQACAKVVEFGSVSLYQYFRGHYSGLLTKGLDRAQIEDHLPDGKKNALDGLIIPCRNDAKKFQLAALSREIFHEKAASTWPAPGSEDTELGVLMELEVGHGETEVYARVQA
jgi:hypothetical protein